MPYFIVNKKDNEFIGIFCSFCESKIKLNDKICFINCGHIFHFDLYRIKDTEEAMAAGAEDYIYGDDYCMIEWPETLLPILPENTVEVGIEEMEDGSRVMEVGLLN